VRTACVLRVVPLRRRLRRRTIISSTLLRPNERVSCEGFGSPTVSNFTAEVTAACKTVVTMQKIRIASFCLTNKRSSNCASNSSLRGQAAAAVGPERCLPSHCRLLVFVPGAAQTETRYADFWHRDYGFASSWKTQVKVTRVQRVMTGADVPERHDVKSKRKSSYLSMYGREHPQSNLRHAGLDDPTTDQPRALTLYTNHRYSCLQNPGHNSFFSHMLFDRCELHTQWPKWTTCRREVVD
jgi:hypothetical protein